MNQFGNQEWLSDPARRAAMFQHLHQATTARERMVQAETEKVIEAGPAVGDTVALMPLLRGRIVRISREWPVMAEIEVWRPTGRGGGLVRCTEQRELRHLRAIEAPAPLPEQEQIAEVLPGPSVPAGELPGGNDAPVLLEAAEGPAEGYAEPR